MLWEVISPSAIHTWPPLSCLTLASDQVHNIQRWQQNPLELHTAHGSRAGSQPLSQPGASSSFFHSAAAFPRTSLDVVQEPMAAGDAFCHRGVKNERFWAGSRASRAPRGSVWMMFLCLAGILTQIRAGGRWGLGGCLARVFPATVCGASAQK